RKGMEVHRSHGPAKALLLEVTAALTESQGAGTSPGHRALGRVNLKTGPRSVEERVSQRVADRQSQVDTPPSKVARHKPPPEDPFASLPGDIIATPTSSEVRNMTPPDPQAIRERVSGATTVAKPQRAFMFVGIALVIIGIAVAAYLIFRPM